MYEHPTFDRAIKMYREWDIPNETDYPRVLPLLDRYREDRERRGASKRPFEGYHILFIQHHLGPLLGRLTSFFDAGLRPEDCWFIDIPYSTNRFVWDELRNMGCPAEQAPAPMNHPLRIYDATQIERVSEIVRSLAEAAPEKLLVIDDGGYFLRALSILQDGDRDITHQFGRDRGQTRVALVEQTTRGHRFVYSAAAKVLLDEIQAPLVSTAKSFTKTRLEGVFIGESVATGVLRSIDVTKKYSRAVVLGFGVVGKATVSALQEYGFPIDVVEPDDRKAAQLESAGVNRLARLPSTRHEQHIFDLVIGCTGYGALSLSHRNLLANDAFLVSASSAAIEFNRARFIERANDPGFKSLELVSPHETAEMLSTTEITGAIHQPLTFAGVSSSEQFRFSFANAGFPVNFSGEIECLPMPLIQPTHGLLYAASVEALTRLEAGNTGPYDMNEDYDIWLFVEGMKQLDDPTIWANS